MASAFGPPAAGSADRPVVDPKPLALTLGSLGVVYGDIGTSPLYAFREAAVAAKGDAALAPEMVIGVLSLMLWSLILIVTIKYVLLMLRADNHGEGGIFAIMSLGLQAAPGHAGLLLLLGMTGAAFFFGDCIITPAISVMSAIEGLKLVSPAFEQLVLPASATILIALFVVQSHGTARVGAWFGPIMTLWFAVLAVAGITHVSMQPVVLAAFNPLPGVSFLAAHGLTSLLVLGAVFLTVTGAEALYADLGHFGRKPIQTAWLTLVLPALMLNYLGQGALVLSDPDALENPFFRLYPDWALIPMVVLATVATVIASQAVITGAYSLTRQAVQLGLLPRFSIRHTAESMAGQIYMPRVNWLLLLGVLFVVFAFKSSSALGSAYGIAVTATMILTSAIAFVTIWRLWRWPLWKVLVVLAPLLLLELTFLAGNSIKIFEGGWFPLLVAAALMGIMMSWRRGVAVLVKMTRKDEVELSWLARNLEAAMPHRVPGTAVFLSADPVQAPASLLHNLKHNRVLHERNIVLSIKTEPTPRVTRADRVDIETVSDHFTVVVAHYGFMETPNVPKIFEHCRRKGLNVEVAQTSFFVSRRKLRPTAKSQMPKWQERLFIALSGVAEDATAHFRIPPDRVVEVGTQVTV